MLHAVQLFKGKQEVTGVGWWVMTIRCYQDNVLLELEPVQTLSDGGIHLVQSCSACSGRGYVIHQGNQNRCVRCAGTGVAGKQSMGHRFARVLESGPGYWLSRRGELGSTVETRAFVPNQTRPGMRVIVDALAGTVWNGSITAPRHNPGSEWGEVRVVREAEILAILDEEDVA